MNKVASILRNHAASILQSNADIVAIGLLKQAGMSDEDARYAVLQEGMEKSATAELTYKGIDHEEATRLVKAANINVRELTNVSLVSEEEALADVLEKAAEYIESLAARVEDLEKSASDLQAVVDQVETSASKPALPEGISKMASVGALSFDDLEALKAIPQETLEKVASALEQPWEFGAGAGTSKGFGDPLVEFCLG